jgi:hypothetical protein
MMFSLCGAFRVKFIVAQGAVIAAPDDPDAAVTSRLIGYRLKVRIYDDRPECFLGQSQALTLPRGR